MRNTLSLWVKTISGASWSGTYGLPGTVYDIRLKIDILFVEWWGLCPHTPASISCKGYLII